MNPPSPSTIVSDFLKQEAKTPFREFFLACGLPWEIRTNSQTILQAARETFCSVDKPRAGGRLGLRLWVDSEESPSRQWPKPYVRGLDHLVFAGFDSGSSVLIDLLGRRVVGRFSKRMGADCVYWKTVIFPILLSVSGGSLGLTEIHSACVSSRENGLLLAGGSGSGKSTLSLALAREGFRFLSDDRTICSLHGGRLCAWGTSALLKLRSDAGTWFEELRKREPNDQAELRLEPQRELGIMRARECYPRMIIFLERSTVAGSRLTRVTRSEAAQRLEQDLMAELPEVARRQRKMIEKLLDLPIWRLRYSGPPQSVARRLMRQFERCDGSPVRGSASAHDRAETRAPKKRLNQPRNTRMLVARSTRGTPIRPDPLHRLTPLQYATSLPVMGRTIRLETNDQSALEHMTELFAAYPGSPTRTPEFVWKIVSQSHPRMKPPLAKRFAFTSEGLRFTEFGQSNFLAVDLDAREAIGFLSEGLIEDQVVLTSPILDNLFCMTVGSLRLVPMRANCVVLGQRGLLVFGAPDSGKTSASYYAGKLGLEFHADDGVFLEAKAGQLHAWGGFWPAAFRPEALQFMPELEASTRPLLYHDFTFYHLRKHPSRTTKACSVSPVGCVFLNRRSANAANLSPIPRSELPKRFLDNVIFKDDDRFTKQQAAVFTLLEKLPAYQLAYDSDPATAAPLMHKLLNDGGR
jgi:hypothetical protein